MPPGLGDARAALRRADTPAAARTDPSGAGLAPRETATSRGRATLPVRPQGVEQARREHRVAVLAALALLDADRHPRRVDIGDAQMQHFVEAQARPRTSSGASCDASDSARGRSAAATSSRLRRAGSLPGCRGDGMRERRPVALQRLVIEEPQPMHDDVAGAPGALAVANQMQQIRLHLLIGDLIR